MSASAPSEKSLRFDEMRRSAWDNLAKLVIGHRKRLEGRTWNPKAFAEFRRTHDPLCAGIESQQVVCEQTPDGPALGG